MRLFIGRLLSFDFIIISLLLLVSQLNRNLILYTHLKKLIKFFYFVRFKFYQKHNHVSKSFQSLNFVYLRIFLSEAKYQLILVAETGNNCLFFFISFPVGAVNSNFLSLLKLIQEKYLDCFNCFIVSRYFGVIFSKFLTNYSYISKFSIIS